MSSISFIILLPSNGDIIDIVNEIAEITSIVVFVSLEGAISESFPDDWHIFKSNAELFKSCIHHMSIIPLQCTSPINIFKLKQPINSSPHLTISHDIDELMNTTSSISLPRENSPLLVYFGDRLFYFHHFKSDLFFYKLCQFYPLNTGGEDVENFKFKTISGDNNFYTSLSSKLSNISPTVKYYLSSITDDNSIRLIQILFKYFYGYYLEDFNGLSIEVSIDIVLCTYLLCEDQYNYRKLTQHFKDFFKWINTSKCPVCQSKLAPISSGGLTPLVKLPNHGFSPEAISRIEHYLCQSCGYTFYFPRIEDPRILLEYSKYGRCGEYVNAFILFCLTFGGIQHIRYVLDYSDHVWVEFYDDRSSESYPFIHADPCEGICEQNTIYEQGWGKTQFTQIYSINWFSIVNVYDYYVQKISPSPPVNLTSINRVLFANCVQDVINSSNLFNVYQSHLNAINFKISNSTIESLTTRLNVDSNWRLENGGIGRIFENTIHFEKNIDINDELCFSFNSVICGIKHLNTYLYPSIMENTKHKSIKIADVNAIHIFFNDTRITGLQIFNKNGIVDFVGTCGNDESRIVDFRQFTTSNICVFGGYFDSDLHFIGFR